MKNADLHTHSYYSSDGTVSPTNLIKEAKSIGLKYIALTDHDSVEGNAEALKAGKKYGVEVIPGIELHSEYGEVLGFFIDYKNQDLINLCEENQKKINERTLKIIKKLAKNGYVLNPKEILKKYNREIMRKPLIAMGMVDKGYAESFRDAFDRILTQDKYNIKANLLSTIEVIKIITSANGVAVLAHPYYEDYQSEFKNIKKLIKAGLVGMEYPNMIKNIKREEFRSPEEYDQIVKIADKIEKIAKKHDLILTSGSDYHGSESPHNIFGLANCDESVVKELKKRLKNNR